MTKAHLCVAGNICIVTDNRWHRKPLRYGMRDDGKIEATQHEQNAGERGERRTGGQVSVELRALSPLSQNRLSRSRPFLPPRCSIPVPVDAIYK